MNNNKLKRFCAYIIDIMIVLILISLASQIKFLNPKYTDYIKKYDELQKFTDKIYDEISNGDAIKIVSSEYIDLFYHIEYYGISYKIIQFVIIVLYFTMFPKFNKGQTIGQSIMHIKVLDLNDKEAGIKNLFYKALVLPININIFFNIAIMDIMNVFLILIVKPKIYFYLNISLTLIVNLLCYADIISIFISKDGTMLHDKLTKTKVVEKC